MNNDETTRKLDPCPDEDALRAYSNGKTPEDAIQRRLKAHLDFCLSCRRRLKSLESGSHVDTDTIRNQADLLRKRAEEFRRAKSEGPKPGTAWRAIPKNEADVYGPLLLVCDDDTGASDNLVRVAEVSESIESAIHTDVILDEKQSGLGFRCMVRAQNAFVTRKGNLKDYVGTIDERVMNRIREFVPHPDSLDKGLSLTDYSFWKDEQGTVVMSRGGLLSGMLVTREDDSRLIALTQSREELDYLVTQEEVLHDRHEPPSETNQVTTPRIKKREYLKWIVPLAASLLAFVLGYETALHTTDRPEPPKTKQPVQAAKKVPDESPPLRASVPIIMNRDPFRLPPMDERMLEAARQSDLFVLEGLLRDESRADIRNENGTTPLHMAARMGHLEAMKLILLKGGKIDAKDNEGKTPLMEAAAFGRPNAVKLLLKLLADKEIKDNKGRTARDWAKLNGYPEVAGLLE